MIAMNVGGFKWEYLLSLIVFIDVCLLIRSLIDNGEKCYYCCAFEYLLVTENNLNFYAVVLLIFVALLLLLPSYLKPPKKLLICSNFSACV
jgi:hypothetical protein